MKSAAARRGRGFAWAVLLLCIIASRAFSAAGSDAPLEFIDTYPKSREEIELILDTLDTTVAEAHSAPPIVMMLHGPQAARFLRSSYAENKSLIDKTAQLSAFGVLRVQICETWMRNNAYGREELFPFIGTVPFGAAELERLARDEGYVEYVLDL